MDNLSKIMKKKTDAQFRANESSERPRTSEGAGGEVVIIDPSAYQQEIRAGQNVTIGTAGGAKIINAVLNVLAGENIGVESNPDGSVTISAETAAGLENLIAGENITVVDNEDGTFTINAAGGGGSGEITQATETELGGIKAKPKTSETAEVAIDEATGKLYSQMPSGTTVNNERTATGLLFWVGTEAQYQEIESPDTDTLYFRSGQ